MWLPKKCNQNTWEAFEECCDQVLVTFENVLKIHLKNVVIKSSAVAALLLCFSVILSIYSWPSKWQSCLLLRSQCPDSALNTFFLSYIAYQYVLSALDNVLNYLVWIWNSPFQYPDTKNAYQRRFWKSRGNLVWKKIFQVKQVLWSAT